MNSLRNSIRTPGPSDVVETFFNHGWTQKKTDAERIAVMESPSLKSVPRPPVGVPSSLNVIRVNLCSSVVSLGSFRLTGAPGLVLLILSLLICGTANSLAAVPAVSGRVSSGNVGIAGVTVVLQQNVSGTPTSKIAITDTNGNYIMQGLTSSPSPGAAAVVKFSKPGFTFDPPQYDLFLINDQNILNRDTKVFSGPITGQILSGTFGLPGALVFPGRANNLIVNRTGSFVIPDASSVTITAPIPDRTAGVMSGLSVGVGIVHPNIGDLVIALDHPDGTRVLLHDRTGGSADNLITNYTLANVPGLSTLLGKSPAGAWSLKVFDIAGGNIGTVTNWTVRVDTAAVFTDANGNFNMGMSGTEDLAPSHPAVTSFFLPDHRIFPGVPLTFRVERGQVLGRVNPVTSNPLLQQQVIAGIQLRAQQPPGNTTDASWAVVDLNSGAYDLSLRTTTGAGFTQRLLSGATNVVVVPSGRGMTFSPASITTYSGATNLNFSIIASPPAIALPASVTMNEDTTFFGTAGVADLEQPATALTITSTYSDNPQLIDSAGIVVTGPDGTGTARSLLLTPIPNQFGTATVFVVVSDGALFTTNSIALTVNPVADTPTAGTTGALRLDGVDDYVTVSPGPVIATSGDFTVEAWAYLNPGSTGIREILSQGSSGNAFYLGFANGILRAGDTWQNPGNVTFPVGAWTHLAVVKSASGAFLYTNGVLVASVASITNPVATEFRIGRQYGNNGEYWAGRIDDVRVWTTARTASDIRRTMTVPLVGNESGLRAYYRFDEGSGIIAYDSAPNVSTQGGPEDGYLKNGATWADNTGINGGLGIHRYNVDEDTPTPIFLAGLDVDGRPVNTNLTYSFDTLPQNGTLSRTNGSLHVTAQNPILYTPALNYIGPDSFAYRVTDNTGLAKGATVSINVANVNDVPTISAIPDQLVIEDTTNVIAFVVNDSDANQVKADLAITVVFESGGTVPIQTNWVTTANGTNRTLYLVPARGEIGNVVVSVSVRDTPGDSASQTFELAVIPKPAYAVRDVGTLPGWSTSFGMAINEQGQVAGYASRNTSADGRAFRFNGILDGSTLTDLGAAGSSASYAYGINANGEVTGSVIEGGVLPQAFVYRNGAFTKLGFAAVGNRSEGRAINGLGQIVGFGNITANDTNRALLYTNGVWGVLPSLVANGVVEAFGINDAGQMAGRAVTNGVLRAVLYTAGNRLVAPLIGGAVNNSANAINSAGAVAGAMTISGTARAFRWEQGQNPVLLGGLIPNGSSVAYGINNFRQTVGSAHNSAGATRAFLHSAEQLYDMNDLLPPDSQWQLDEARAINSDGWITGTGRTNGQTRAFIAIPAWVIGRKIARPLGATALVPPEIELLERGSNFDTEQNAFYWSQVEGRLYAIRPVTARLRWRLDANPGNTNRVVSVGQNIWPRTPTIHVANTPSEVQPQGVELPHSYRELQYTTATGAAVDPSAAIFNATGIGYSVLRYVKSDGQSPNEAIHFPAFDVVRTVLWDDPRYLDDNKAAFVGDTLEYAGHFDYLERQGHVYFENAFYDGSGTDRAYDRPTRLGSIIPVNVPNANTAALTNQFVVVWYRTNRLGVAWSGLPVRYAVAWPGNTTNRISIANGLGSGPLEDALHPNKKVYVQPNPYLPGYNPNEEHALIGPSSSGEALYALRNDLNAGLNVSEPYALLKFRSPATAKWAMRTYKVIFEGDPTFDGVAGNAVQPPLPISLMMPQCDNSRILRGPGWKNHLGTIYAKSAGSYGEHAEVAVHWWYQLQPGFYYPADGPREGNCVDWVAVLNGRSRRIEAIYDIRWPDDPPILNIGESLLTPKRGLPGVKDWADASIIYDDLDPYDTNRIYALARFYDPLTPRSISNAASFTLPTEIKQELIIDKVYFPDLPYHLKRRLSYNPQTRELTFAGVLDESAEFGGPDNPLLLPNVMSPREFARIGDLSRSGTWAEALKRLYYFTRNPNRVDLLPQNGQPDDDLRLGLTMSGTEVVLEKFGSGPKALTAGLGGIPPAEPRPLKALNFAGTTNRVSLSSFSTLEGDFTISMWAQVAGNNTGALITNSTAGGGFFHFVPQPGANRFVVSDRTNAGLPGIVAHVFDTNWHHYALVRAFTNLTVLVDGVPVGNTRAFGLKDTSGFRIGEGFLGQIDEFQIRNVALTAADLRRTMRKQLNGREDGLIAYFRFDEGTGTTVTSETVSGLPGTFAASAGIAWVDSTAPAAIPPRFITMAENNDPNRPELPTTLYVVRIDEGPTLGDLKVLPSDNVFDERITMRHSGDFGGAPELMQFEWYYHPDTGGEVATDLPVVDGAGNIIDPRGWLFYSVDDFGQGFNDITIGEGPRNGLLTMSDNWFICRYRGYNIDGTTNWTDWVGQPGGGRAQLAEGWIKRVIDGLNPFEQRSDSFHSTEVATYVNMLTQAGRRYEGPVAFNPDPNFLNSVGLIEAYTTVLERGKSLSIEGTPPVNYEPANTALLLIAGRLADFYMMLGNEAYADSTDPTIGFATDGTGGTDYGVFASSIFAFQNQLDSLLEEELALLRGRDDSAASVRIGPVYNRLFWNFTRGDGELAYAQSYNIIDVNFDGFVNINDASSMFPQGHGDAWGHYLTATTTYYDLLRNTNYTWVPRAESVRLGAAVVSVDYLDERKFARAAAAKAKVGAETVNLTYRQTYVDDPSGQFQGYKDTHPDRAWGLFEWAQRTRQAAYADWLMANTILPAQDPDPSHSGITRIDRTTVTEIAEIAANADEIQAQLDKADRGLNPLGLGKGVVPFDVDPFFLDIGSGTQGRTHFDQIYERAEGAMNNAMNAFNNASQLTTALRRQQDSDVDFARNIQEQERDYKSRLIEIFGYPYAGDIGPGKTYPSDYDGPDLYHYMYANATELVSSSTGTSSSFTNAYTAFEGEYGSFGFYFPGDTTSRALENSVLRVAYPKTAASYSLLAPASWGQRRAPGEVQLALSDLLQADASLRISLANYDALINQIEDAVDLLDAQYALSNAVVTALSDQQTEVEDINDTIKTYRIISGVMRRAGSAARSVAEGAEAAVDADQPWDGIPLGLAVGALVTAEVVETVADGLDGDIVTQETSKEELELTTGLTIETASQSFEVQQRIKEVQQLIRSEPAARIEAYQLTETVRQAATRHQAALAAGQRILQERLAFRRYTAGDIQDSRYQDMTFRVFRNDAVQKYRAQFDLAARYVYLAAIAYDYETQMLGTQNGSGRDFLTQIVRDRSLGVMQDGVPVVGQPGLSDSLGRLKQNFNVLKGQLGLTVPALEGNKFSLRTQMLRIASDESGEEAWRNELKKARVADLWQVPEFRRYCRPFAPESAGAQPGLVIRFGTTVAFGLNYFGWPLGGGDSSYDPTYYATKIRSAGVWFDNYDGAGLSTTPRVFLVPVGIDVLRSPTDFTLATREWKVLDQKIPPPFTLGKTTLQNPAYIPIHDSLSSVFGDVRKFSSLRAYHDSGEFDESEAATDTRLIGRSVWNTEWMLIIPGGTLLFNPNQGLDTFINSVGDIRIFFQSYSYSGN